MNRPVDCDAPSIPVVRLANRRVQRLIVHMDDPRSSGCAEFDRGREPPDEERPDEVMDLLSVRDAGERGVLPADEDAGVPHHGDQETRLTVREAERRERSIAFRGTTISIRPVRFHVGCFDHRKACCSYERCEMTDS